MKKVLCFIVSFILILGLSSIFVHGATENDIEINPEANSSSTAVAMSEEVYEINILDCNLGKGWDWSFNGIEGPLPQTLSQKDLNYCIKVKLLKNPEITEEGLLILGENKISFRPYKRYKKIVTFTVNVTKSETAAEAESNSVAANEVNIDVENSSKPGNDTSNGVNINPEANSSAYAWAEGENASATSNSAAVNLINLAIENNSDNDKAPISGNNVRHNKHDKHNKSDNDVTNNVNINPTANSSSTAVAYGENALATSNSYAINVVNNVINNYTYTKTETKKNGKKHVKIKEEYIITTPNSVEDTNDDSIDCLGEQPVNKTVYGAKETLPKTGESGIYNYILYAIGIVCLIIATLIVCIRKYGLSKSY